MQRWSLRRVVSLLLGITVFLGVSLTGVWSGDMAVLAANPAPPSQGACLACGTDDGATETMDVCAFLCGVLANAVSPRPTAVEPASGLTFDASRARLGRSRKPSPERSPPRPIELG